MMLRSALLLVLLPTTALAQDGPRWFLDPGAPMVALELPDRDDVRFILTCERGGIELDPMIFPETRPPRRIALRFTVDGTVFVRAAVVDSGMGEAQTGYGVSARVAKDDELIAAMAAGRRMTVAIEPTVPGTRVAIGLAGSGKPIRALVARC